MIGLRISDTEPILLGSFEMYKLCGIGLKVAEPEVFQIRQSNDGNTQELYSLKADVRARGVFDYWGAIVKQLYVRPEAYSYC
jgi:hypothetical protein